MKIEREREIKMEKEKEKEKKIENEKRKQRFRILETTAERQGTLNRVRKQQQQKE